MERRFNPGEFRHKITFLAPPIAQDNYGAPMGAWTEFKTNVKASKEPLLGNEYFSAEAVQSKVEVKFRMRWFNGALDTMRIKHGDDIYQILSAINVKSLNRELLCYCKKVS